MKLSVAMMNGTPVVPLSEAVKISNELEAYKMAYKNLRTQLSIIIQAWENENVDTDAERGSVL